MAEKKSKVAEIKKGHFLSETQYYEVTGVDSDKINVKNERGFGFGIANQIVEEGAYSANQFEEKIPMTRTELIEVFNNVGDTVFEVNFDSPLVKAINEAIAQTNALLDSFLPTKERLQKIVKQAYKGENRTLIGYLIKTETGFGRSMVIDLEKEKGDNPKWDGRISQVDHRTLNYLITKNKKYFVKK